MSAKSTGGLCGKARRQHKRSRSARLFAKKLVDDFNEPDWVEPLIERHVPIGRRSEFLNSAEPLDESDPIPTPSDLASEVPSVQLDLELGGAEPKDDRAVSFGDDAQTHVVEPPAVLLVKRVKPSRHEPAPVSRPARAKSTYTFGGFLLGCAMGSAAAVMMLLVMQATVG